LLEPDAGNADGANDVGFGLKHERDVVQHIKPSSERYKPGNGNNTLVQNRIIR
jgi:hypothetical protein